MIASGTEGTCTWEIDDNGIMTLSNGVITHIHTDGIHTITPVGWSWNQYRSQVTQLIVTNVSWAVGASSNAMFYKFTNCQSMTFTNVDATNITNAGGMFEECRAITNLDLSGFVTSNLTSMCSMFEYCSALTSLNISNFDTSNVETMLNCFMGCRSLTSLDVSSFDTSQNRYFSGMFWYCASLTSLDLSNFNTSQSNEMGQMFQGCRSLVNLDISSFDISEMVYMNNVFRDCEALDLEFHVNGTPTYYSNIFAGTTKNIYIINDATDQSTPSKSAVATTWRNIVADYSNVHYEADDHPAPSLSSFSATRVASNGSTTPAEKGLWVYLSAQANISTEYLPVGWASEFGSTTTTMDNATITPAWTVSASTGTITLTAWVNINDLSAHTFTLSISELIKEGTTTKKTLTTATLTATLPKAYALVDYYHDPVTGTEGFAIGKYAEHADLFDVAMPSLFEDTLTAQDMTSQEIDDFVDSIGGEGDPIADVVSEAITQNDLREILSRTVGSIPSEYKKLLWTNPSPTANFAPQTIALDLSGYDDIEVVANPFADLQYQYSVICPVGAGGNLEYQILNTATATNASTFINGVSRTFRVSTSGITFDNGQMTYNGGAYTNWQGRAIPYKIYGIKYEKVQPPVLDAEIEVLATGATLYRIGRIRILSLVDFPYGTSLTVGVGDRPTTTAVGFGTRHNGSAYITMLRMEVATSGGVSIFLVGFYNTTTGYTGTATGDVYNAIAIWYVAE